MPAEKILDPARSAAALWGSELRHYRQAAGVSQPELAQRIYCSRQLIGAMEIGDRIPERTRVRDCDEALDTGGSLQRLYEKLQLSAFPKWFRDWPPQEERATEIRGYEAMVVPGLLQTQDYIWALLEGDESAVAARLERQKILSRSDPPPPILRYILDEGVLRREVGDPAIMRAQLEYLLKVASSRITIQIVPIGVHAGLSGNFHVATLDNGDSKGYTDTAVRGLIVDHPEDIDTLVEAFESLRTDALPKKQSLATIKEVAEQWT
jgi:transcriptional regulator with XRE-family HTH domain